MSEIFESPASVLPLSSSSRSMSSRSPSARRTLRERCGFALQLSNLLPPPPRTLRERCGFDLRLTFSPAFPNIAATGPVRPTAGNLPRRKHCSVVSLDLLPPSVDFDESRTEYFA